MKLRQAHNQAREPSTLNHLEQLDKIFDDSLTYTRTLIADLAPPSLQEFGLMEALKWLREQMRSHGLSVTVKTDLPHINLPEDQAILLFQSVRELLFNVMKHAQTDVALVKLDATKTGEFRVVVEDSGVGFDAAGLVARDSKTTRFGLFSVSERMQALGGRIELESSPSRGTRVSMILPYWSSDDKKSPVLVAQACVKSNGAGEVRSAMATAQSDVSFVRVMLVDDHTMVRKGIKSILDNHEGITVVAEASDGQEAVSLAKQIRPDIVIMDVNLPILDGVAATNEITRQCPEARVIGLSVHESSHWKEAIMKAGAVGFVSKGSVTEELYSAIERAMQAKTQDV